jgi:pimeloyl-ACP methyl ester carboxylesterase
VMPISLMAVAQTLIPDSRMVVVPAAGHSVYFEQPETFNHLVLEFFTSCRSGSRA